MFTLVLGILFLVIIINFMTIIIIVTPRRDYIFNCLGRVMSGDGVFSHVQF